MSKNKLSEEEVHLGKSGIIVKKVSKPPLGGTMNKQLKEVSSFV